MRASTAVDNTSNLFTDALVSVVIKTNAAGVSSTGWVQVYAYATSNGGTNYSGGASGSDGAYSGLTANLMPIGRISVVANATTYPGGPFSVAAAFGGSLPASWGIAVENRTGAALDASVGSANYQGVLAQYT